MGVNLINDTSIYSSLDDSLATLTDSEFVNQVITWHCHQQKGYKFIPPLNSPLPLHDYNEDSFFPTKLTPPSDYISIHNHKIFLVADGHAGHEAPLFFINGLATKLLALLNSNNWNFSIKSHQSQLISLITDIYQSLDDEYTLIKTLEYQEWCRQGSVGKKPMDDGCTMIVNIIQPGWVLNCNVGDSRTLIAKPSSYSKKWSPVFSSIDHNMMHPDKVFDIHNNGGLFLDGSGKIVLHVNVQHPNERGSRQYTELCNSRIFRPLSAHISDVGCSHRRTLNLTATLGDLLFKIKPPVLSCKPDITFIELDPTEHILIMATDGLWDHLKAPNTQTQNTQVLDKTISMINELTDLSLDDKSMCSDSSLPSSFEEALSVVCASLVDREGDTGNGLFADGLNRYDDATVMIIHLDV
ncbi:phosphatase 2C-like domain-containing protein [Globomyces pollinis-pini]|nr:phosphatase 2C-like domain-containing protein [Globomyces pollinis-pini]